MAKKKKYIYILMMSDDGCVFITDIDYGNKTAKWEKDKKFWNTEYKEKK